MPAKMRHVGPDVWQGATNRHTHQAFRSSRARSAQHRHAQCSLSHLCKPRPHIWYNSHAGVKLQRLSSIAAAAAAGWCLPAVIHPLPAAAACRAGCCYCLPSAEVDFHQAVFQWAVNWEIPMPLLHDTLHNLQGTEDERIRHIG